MELINKIIVSYLTDGISNTKDNKVFFANLLVQIKKESNKDIGTMGVTIKNSQLYLYYNEDWINEILKNEGLAKVKGVIEHELLHLVFNHIKRGDIFKRRHDIYNIACDLAINQLIGKDKLPKACLFPDMSELKKYNLEPEKNAEHYYKKLIEKADKVKLNILDNHNGWGEIKENDKTASELVKSAIKTAYDQSKKSQGHLSGALEEYIKELFTPPTINWKTLLRQYIAYSIKYGHKRSWKKPNRRFSDRSDIKGHTPNRTAKILLAIDTSGSVSDKDFQDFLAEVKGIMVSQKCDIDMIQCDSDIVDKGRLRKSQKLNVKFKGRGGTSFKPVFDYLQKRPDYDMLIYFTDLYCDFKDCHTYKNVIWVLTRQANTNEKPPFGKVVQIND